MRGLCLVAVCGLAGSAAAQSQTNGRLVFEFDRVVVSPANPGVTLTVSAAWDQAMPGDFVFLGADYDLAASSGEFTGASLILWKTMLSNDPGTVAGSRVNGAAIGQPPCTIAGCPALPDNPIVLAEYTWETTDFNARTVTFESENTRRFFVVPGPGGPTINLYPEHFTPGFGSITVVPAPAAAGAWAGVLWAVRRRRG